MFDVGFSEILLLGAIALVFIGPKQLPEVARVIARLLNELKRATGDIGSTVFDIKNQSDDIFRDTKNTLTKTLLEGGKELRASMKPEVPAEPAKKDEPPKPT